MSGWRPLSAEGRAKHSDGPRQELRSLAAHERESHRPYARTTKGRFDVGFTDTHAFVFSSRTLPAGPKCEKWVPQRFFATHFQRFLVLEIWRDWWKSREAIRLRETRGV